jgi:hypothetical protein
LGCVACVELLERLCLALAPFRPTPRVLPAEPASQADSSGPARLTSGAATLHHIWPTIRGPKRNSPRQPKWLPNRSPALAWPPAFIQDGFLQRTATQDPVRAYRAAGQVPRKSKLVEAEESQRSQRKTDVKNGGPCLHNPGETLCGTGPAEKRGGNRPPV